MRYALLNESEGNGEQSGERFFHGVGRGRFGKRRAQIQENAEGRRLVGFAEHGFVHFA